MIGDTTPPRRQIRAFFSDLVLISLVLGLFGAVLAFFPAIYVASQFGGQAALNAIGALALIVLAASFVATWNWGAWRNAGGRDVPLPHTSASSPEERLAELLSFTPADLELNRSGRMSRAQRLRLLQADLGWLIFAVVCFGEAASVALVMGYTIRQPSFMTLGKEGLIGLLGIGWGIWALVRVSKGVLDALGGRVTSERTRLSPHPDQSGAGTTVCRLRTDGGNELRVWQEAYDAIAPETLYWVHSAPQSRKLISLEEVSEAPAFQHGESTYVIRDRRVASAVDMAELDAARGVGESKQGERPRRETAWAILLAAVAMFHVLIGLSVAAEFHATASLDIAAALASFAPLIIWLVYANRLPTRRSALRTARGVALFVTLAIPWTIWSALHGMPCPPNCGPGT